MCGFAGIKTKSEDKEILLSRMMNALIHRGPDAQGKYLEGEIAFGHRRLKVIDLSEQANQPMCNEDERIWIIFNGEIYNFIDLRRELESKGHRFKSNSDTEVIVHSYEEWGTACLNKLRGMFAFGIWDATKEVLFLARDRFGIKPLYYYFKSGILIFASEVRAILASGSVTKKLCLEGLESYLDYGGLKEPLTVVEDIRSLMPGHYAVLNKDDLRILKYWDLLDINDQGYRHDLEPKHIRENLTYLLEETVKSHLVSDVPIGIFLSGGIDSSSLVSLASGMTQELRSVSMIFGEERFNEARYSRLIAEKYKTRHYEVSLTARSVLSNINSCLKAMDQPTFNGINTYFISKAAREAGLTVALSGLGGDEVFGGYPGFARIPRLMQFLSFWNAMPGFFRKSASGMFSALMQDTTKNRKIADFLGAASPGHPYYVTRILFTKQEKRCLLGTSNMMQKAGKMEIGKLKSLDVFNQVSYLEMTNYMTDILLRDADFMSMAHSLEVRVPLVDHRLIEYVFSIPGKFKIRKRFQSLSW